ncbi:class I SAM-dependent methyltransferase [Paenibacillus nanensis]|nr:SAM-dependent methyltransferase [Paenibacillus nanensis]
MPSFPDTPLAAKIAGQIAGSSQLGRIISNRRHEGRMVPSISFCSYMEACLYDEQYGYYQSGAVRVGKSGDFFTSSAIGTIMAEVIARYAADFGREYGFPVTLAEWGAGTGKLSADIAAAFRNHRSAEEMTLRPLIVENHPGHAAAAAESFRTFHRAGGGQPVVLSSVQFGEQYAKWMSDGSVLVLANELLDAFPVHRIRRRGKRLVELGVAVVPDEGFALTEMAVTDPRLADWLKRDGIFLREGQTTEICPGVRDWLFELSSRMPKGKVMIIDYGHDAEEYAAEHRMEGTLMTYWRHQASDSPLLGAGERDITAHVSFAFVKASAREAGFEVVYYDTQKQFLVDYGVFELLRNHDGMDPFGEAARRNRAVRQLLLSDSMSESFKVMVLEKK